MLNKNEDYGTVHGHPHASFEQNGKLYNVHGQEIDEDGTVIEPKAKLPKKKVSPPPQAAQEADEEEGDEENEGDESDDEGNDEGGDVTVDGVNLSAWARGELTGDAHVPFPKVKSLIAKHFKCAPPKNAADGKAIVDAAAKKK